MNVQERIAKLQSLLDRVTARATDPRPRRGAPLADARVAAPLADARVAGANVAANVAEQAPAAARVSSVPPSDVEVRWSEPPAPQPPIAADARASVADAEAVPEPASAPRSAGRAIEVDAGSGGEADFELPEPAIELQTADAAQSDERLIAAHPEESDAADAPPADAKLEDAQAEIRGAARESVSEAPEAIEVATEYASEAELEDGSAPASSRRPVTPDLAASLGETVFGGAEQNETPRHTPPPESGKLPAAPEHVAPLETREIASVAELADYDNQDITGVHHTAQSERRAESRRASDDASEGGAPLAADGKMESGRAIREQSRVDLIPEATRGAAEASDQVAELIGEAQRFQPATLGDLLDATLAL